MAFGFLKKIVSAPVKLAGGIVRKVKPIVKLAAPVLRPVYETAVPKPIRRAVKIATQAVPLVRKLFRPEVQVNQFEKAVRDILTTVLTLKDKSAIEIAIGIAPLLFSLKSIFDSIDGVPKSDYAPQLAVALDNLIGTEDNALIGPGEAALVKIDLKFVDLEALSDLIIKTAEKAVLAADEPTQP